VPVVLAVIVGSVSTFTEQCTGKKHERREKIHFCCKSAMEKD